MSLVAKTMYHCLETRVCLTMDKLLLHLVDSLSNYGYILVYVDLKIACLDLGFPGY